MVIKKINEIKIEDIITILENSGLVILPFDTCYGICCNPSDQKAVEKLLQYKERREGKAISISVSDIEMASKYVDINDTAKSIYERFLPGPYTVISISKGEVIKGIEAENGTLGIRIPQSEWILSLIREYNNPITSTSANQAYQKTPYQIEDILQNATKKSLELVDLIVDGGKLKYNPPSTVMDTTLGEIQVVRKGQFLPEGSKVNEVVTNSEIETIQFGKELLERFKTNLEYRPLIFALQGDLGAGKTQFTKGLAQALNVKDQIVSPTFILSREYDLESGNKLIHIDTWRLENDGDFEALGFKEMLSQSSAFAKATVDRSITNLQSSDKSRFNVLSIEWADKVSDYLRKVDVNHKIIWIEIVADADSENKRIIRWSE
jgi:L-threonylcarbamoyladenylate synthase